MTIKEVAGLLGYSTERVETLIANGLILPKSGVLVKLAVTSEGGAVDISDDQFNEWVGKFDAEEPGRWPPAGVRRELLVECRHRCAICANGPPLQFHHMLDWANVKHHDPRHMLPVCGTCHAHCTNGFIDRKAQLAYKTQIKRRATSGERQVGTGFAQQHAVPTGFRSIEDTELRPWLTVGERVAIRELEEEFGCEVRTNVTVTAGNGWINFNAAVVRGEDLVGIEIYEYKGGGLPYFQIDHLIQVGSQVKFDRFQTFVLYVAVISAVDPKLDELVRAELQKRKSAATCEFQFRMYRLNPSRTKYSM